MLSKGEKMEENNDPISEYKPIKKIKINFKVIFIIFFILYMIVFGGILLLISLQDNIDEEDKIRNYSSLDVIEYNNGSKIPTLYKYTRYQKTKGSKYRYEDDRFGDSVTTIEILFSDIPEEYLNTYKNALIEEGYLYVADWEGDEVYTKAEKGIHPQTLKIEPFNSFAIIGNTRIIYGVLLGSYERIFK